MPGGGVEPLSGQTAGQLPHNNSMAQHLLDQPFLYNGESRDVTGLDYLRARYYDSNSGTFLTADSYLGTSDNPLSQNRYAYVQNNPINYVDPSGHIRDSILPAWIEESGGRPVVKNNKKPVSTPILGMWYMFYLKRFVT